jgi:hypothetical protein
MSRDFVNGGSWAARAKKRPFFKRVEWCAPVGNRGDNGAECLENGLPNLTKFYGAGKGGIGAIPSVSGSLNRNFLFFC